MTLTPKNYWILSDELLENTPSRSENISAKQEYNLRYNSCRFIHELHTALRGNHYVQNTACVIFHRFFAFQSFKQHNRFIIAVACWFLAAKIEERPRKIMDVINVFFGLRYNAKPTEVEVKELQEKIIVAERIVLQTINYDLKIDNPYGPLLQKLEELKLYLPEHKRDQVSRQAIKLVGDSHLTCVCLEYEPYAIAMGAIFMACLQIGCNPLRVRSLSSSCPNSTSEGDSLARSWCDLIVSSCVSSKEHEDFDDGTLKGVCNTIFSVYNEENYKIVPAKSIAGTDGVDVVALRGELSSFGVASTLKRKSVKSNKPVKVSDNGGTADTSLSQIGGDASLSSLSAPIMSMESICDGDKRDIEVERESMRDNGEEMRESVVETFVTSLAPVVVLPSYKSPSKVFTNGASPNSIGPPPTPDRLPPPTPEYVIAEKANAVEDTNGFVDDGGDMKHKINSNNNNSNIPVLAFQNHESQEENSLKKTRFV